MSSHSDDRGVNSRRHLGNLVLLTILVLVTRIIFRSHYLYDIDSVNFALGMQRFDPSVYQPHPPGYFLYVLLGRAANLLFHDANAAMVAISVAAGCGALYTIYALAYNWFGRNAAAFAGLVFAFSPLAWFHGTVALTYGVEQFFSGLAGYFLWRVYGGAQRFVVPAALTVGLAAGFRPSFLLFVGPLILFSVAFARGRLSRARLLGGAAVLSLTLAAWFVPMVIASGGFHAYWSSLISLWRIAPAKQTVFNSNPAVSTGAADLGCWIYLVVFRMCWAGGVPQSKPGRAADEVIHLDVGGAGTLVLHAGFPLVCQQRIPAGDLSTGFRVAWLARFEVVRRVRMIKAVKVTAGRRSGGGQLPGLRVRSGVLLLRLGAPF